MRWRSLGIDESKWAYTAPFMLAFRDLNNMKADAFEANLARKRSCPGSFESAGEGYRAQVGPRLTHSVKRLSLKHLLHNTRAL